MATEGKEPVLPSKYRELSEIRKRKFVELEKHSQNIEALLSHAQPEDVKVVRESHKIWLHIYSYSFYKLIQTISQFYPRKP